MMPKRGCSTGLNVASSHSLPPVTDGCGVLYLIQRQGLCRPGQPQRGQWIYPGLHHLRARLTCDQKHARNVHRNSENITVHSIPYTLAVDSRSHHIAPYRHDSLKVLRVSACNRKQTSTAVEPRVGCEVPSQAHACGASSVSGSRFDVNPTR